MLNFSFVTGPSGLPGRAGAAPEKYGAPQCFEDYDERLARGDSDSLTAGTPIGLHCEQGLKPIVLRVSPDAGRIGLYGRGGQELNVLLNAAEKIPRSTSPSAPGPGRRPPRPAPR